MSKKVWGFSKQNLEGEDVWARQICAHVTTERSVCTMEIDAYDKESGACRLHATCHATEPDVEELNQLKRLGPDGVIQLIDNSYYLTRTPCKECGKMPSDRSKWCPRHKDKDAQKRKRDETPEEPTITGQVDQVEFAVPQLPPMKRHAFEPDVFHSTMVASMQTIIARELEPIKQDLAELRNLYSSALSPHDKTTRMSGDIPHKLWRISSDQEHDMRRVLDELEAIRRRIEVTNRTVISRVPQHVPILPKVPNPFKPTDLFGVPYTFTRK